MGEAPQLKAPGGHALEQVVGHELRPVAPESRKVHAACRGRGAPGGERPPTVGEPLGPAYEHRDAVLDRLGLLIEPLGQAVYSTQPSKLPKGRLVGLDL